MPKDIWLPPGIERSTPTQLEKEALRRGDLSDRSLMMTGLFETGKSFRFQCPICHKIEANDQRMEPVCTGPGWTDTHPHEPMVFIGSE